MLFDRFYDVFVEFLKEDLRVVACLVRSLLHTVYYIFMIFVRMSAPVRQRSNCQQAAEEESEKDSL